MIARTLMITPKQALILALTQILTNSTIYTSNNTNAKLYFLENFF